MRYQSGKCLVATLLVVSSIAGTLVTQRALMRSAADEGLNRIARPPMAWDEQLGWAPKPHYSSYSHSFLTGEFGVRMSSDRLTPLRQHAVLAVGDSFTIGSEVGNSQSWPAHLERMLGTQVINAGSGAWGVDQMVLRAEQLAPVLHPSTVIVGTLDQDITRNNYRVYGRGYKPYFTIENNELVLRGTPVRIFDGSRSNLGVWRSLFGHSYALDWIAERFNLIPLWTLDGQRYQAAHDYGPEVSRLLLHRLARLGKQYAFNVLVVLLYGGGDASVHAKHANWVDPTFQGAGESGVPAVDMFPILRKFMFRTTRR